MGFEVRESLCMVRLKLGSKLGHMVTWPLTFEFSDVEVGHGSLELSPDQRPLQQRLTGGIDGRRGDDEVEGQQAHHGPPIPHRAGGPSIAQTIECPFAMVERTFAIVKCPLAMVEHSF